MSFSMLVEKFRNPIRREILTSIFIREKRLRYLETAISALSTLSLLDSKNIDKVNELLKDYHGLMFPEDQTRKRFKEEASEKMKKWSGKTMDISGTDGRFSMVVSDING